MLTNDILRSSRYSLNVSFVRVGCICAGPLGVRNSLTSALKMGHISKASEAIEPLRKTPQTLLRRELRRVRLSAKMKRGQIEIHFTVQWLAKQAALAEWHWRIG